MLLAASDPRALWYATRGFGLADLVLLTVSVALGVAQVARYARPGLPRFIISGLHRNVSLLALLLLAVHIATAVADPFAPIGVAAVFIPFAGRYRPLWLGLGALASDLLLALVVTSLFRDRIRPRLWRLVHWGAYACWPIALVHGLGTGSDSRLGWTQALYAACSGVVLIALAWRLASRWTVASAGARLGAAAATLALAVAVAAWAAQGPLKAGWARRAGTPPSLLGSSRPTHSDLSPASSRP